MRDHLLIYLNGRPIRVTGEDARATLAEFLRRQRRLTGTKIVCAEGDCGACAVLAGRVSADGASIRYASVNSCIQMMFQLDATHVITVEGLKQDGELNPIQKAMVACHGTQCGFCTPGFIVSLCDVMQQSDVQAHDVRRALVGNLCRCTGYDSIVRAAMQTDRASMRKLDELYPPGEICAALAAAGAEEVALSLNEFQFFKPVSLDSACHFLAAHPDSLIFAGATDLGVQRNKGTRTITRVMSVAALSELIAIEINPRGLLVGAAVTLSELESATAACFLELSRSLAYFGSPLIKNAATLAGNLVNASPIGDTIPAFFALQGEVEIAGPKSRRWVGAEDFYTGYRKTILTDGEMVTRLFLPIPKDGEIFKIYKVSRRKDLDISSFGAAIWLRASGSRIEQIRIAYGGVAATVIRLVQTEAFLTDKILSREGFAEAGKIAANEVHPISDVRGSEAYRRVLAGNILIKFWNDFDGAERDPAAGPPMETSRIQS
jgi:xanthine dehydrogenase small subunit